MPGAPGRVVTLVPQAGAICWGRAFEIDAAVWEDIVVGLDHREKDGYARRREIVRLGERRTVEAEVFVATETNPSFLGDAPLEVLVAQIREAVGPSGTNVEYVLALSRALRATGVVDPHVEEIASRLVDSGR